MNNVEQLEAILQALEKMNKFLDLANSAVEQANIEAAALAELSHEHDVLNKKPELTVIDGGKEENDS